MTVSEKIKTIKPNKTQYNLYQQTAKISALSSEDFGKFEFLTGEDVNIQRFEYSPLGSELKKQTDTEGKQYRG